MTNLEKAIQRARERNPDYDSRSHRGNVVELMIGIKASKELITHVVLCLAGTDYMPSMAVKMPLMWGEEARMKFLAESLERLKDYEEDS